MDNGHREQETRLRLLNAAGEIFSKKGFRAATVREICAKADANVAAVNYHFSSKKNLYLAVLEYAHAEAFRRFPPDMGLPERPSPEDRLFALVRSMLLRTLGKGRPAWHGKLMARERLEPTGLMDDFIDRAILPRARLLQEIVAELLGASAAPLTIHLCAQSVAGQCRHYFASRDVIRRVSPGLSLDEAGLEDLARHIIRFSLAGIHAYARPSLAAPNNDSEHPTPGELH